MFCFTRAAERLIDCLSRKPNFDHPLHTLPAPSFKGTPKVNPIYGAAFGILRVCKPYAKV